jgi:hypothetical protein
VESVNLFYKTHSGETLQKVLSADAEIVLLSGLGITSIDLSPLEHCSKLRELHITSNWLEYVDLAPLQQCTNLELLSLSLNRLLEVDLTPLAKCPEFIWLNLERNWLQQVDISPLFHCPRFMVFEVDYDVELIADPKLLEMTHIPEGLKGILKRIKTQEMGIPSEFLMQRIQQVLELFQTLPPEQLVELLHFPTQETLVQWLSSLPVDFPISIEENEVHILSDTLHDEARQAIIDHPVLANSLSTPSNQGVQLELGIGVEFKQKISEESLLRWVRDAMTSHEESRFRHAAIEGWTVLEALLGILFRVYFKESKPIHLSYLQLIQYMAPHLPEENVILSMLNQAYSLRNRIYPGSDDPTSSAAEQIIESALELYSKLDALMAPPEPTEEPVVRVPAREVPIQPATTQPVETRPVRQEYTPSRTHAPRAGQQRVLTPCCEVEYNFTQLKNWVRSRGTCPECHCPLIIRRDQVVKL